MRLLLLSLIALLAVPMPATQARDASTNPPPPTLQEIFADPEMQAVQLSPTGRYLTWLAPKNQRMNLAILDRETRKLRWLTDMKIESVVSHVWAKPDRILFAQQYGGREQYGMFACDPDGSNLIVINKLEKVEATADGLGEGDLPSGVRDLPKTLVSLLPKDRDHILMNRLRGNSGLGDVVKVNIRNGREVVHETNYIGARVWIADANGEVRAEGRMANHRRVQPRDLAALRGSFTARTTLATLRFRKGRPNAVREKLHGARHRGHSHARPRDGCVGTGDLPSSPGGARGSSR
jgi:hypothetical protein